MKVLELGHVVLYVEDLERSRRFYRDVLGWDEIAGDVAVDLPAAAFTSGRTHHELLLIEVGPGAAPVPGGRRVGMYHFGLKVGDTDDELRQVVAELEANGVRVRGSADHTVTHSLYIEDPDGNEIELYVDVLPAETWRSDPSAVLAPVRPLRL
ncbi:MAG TPA: VOC family protein [Acidimicrobiales bacterium]|nr:VOC family protein [Acidimicrobiales bacterium]